MVSNESIVAAHWKWGRQDSEGQHRGPGFGSYHFLLMWSHPCHLVPCLTSQPFPIHPLPCCQKDSIQNANLANESPVSRHLQVCVRSLQTHKVLPALPTSLVSSPAGCLTNTDQTTHLLESLEGLRFVFCTKLIFFFLKTWYLLFILQFSVLAPPPPGSHSTLCMSQQIKIVSFVLLPASLGYKPCKDRDHFRLPSYFQHPAQCLWHGRCSVNIC